MIEFSFNACRLKLLASPDEVDGKPLRGSNVAYELARGTQ
jgi:hypothetical protein